MSDAEPDDPETDWSAVGYVLASDYRERVLAVLADAEATPVEIHERTGIEFGSVSTSLTGLREHGMVELLVPEERRKGRVYGTTEKGDRVHAEVRDR